MKNIENVVEFSELLAYAESIGISWNKAHEFLVDDGVPPMYESEGSPNCLYKRDYIRA